MFVLNGLKVRGLMKAQGLDAATLARCADLDKKFIEDVIGFGGEAKTLRDFEPLQRLAQVLKVSPLTLI